MPPKVSINLCCYNSEKYLEETLQSIFAQTYTDWELVIVNDGSTDSTEEIIKRYLGNGRKIIYHYQPNAGLGNARNKASELSSGEFLAFIDHDDLWNPKKLELQIGLFESNPELGLVYCDGETIDSQGNRILRYSRKHQLHRGDIFDELVKSSFIPPTSAIIRRKVFDEMGPFPNFKAAEEYDLFLKIAYRYPIDYVDESLFKYRSHGGNLSRTGSRESLHKEIIAIRQYWMESIPYVQKPRFRQIRKLAALAYTSYGVWLLKAGRIDEARPNFVLSLKLHPFQLRYIHLGLSCLPTSFARQALKWIRGVRGHFKPQVLLK